jgi:chromosome segregation ATPase
MAAASARAAEAERIAAVNTSMSYEADINELQQQTSRTEQAWRQEVANWNVERAAYEGEIARAKAEIGRLEGMVNGAAHSGAEARARDTAELSELRARIRVLEASEASLSSRLASAEAETRRHEDASRTLRAQLEQAQISLAAAEGRARRVSVSSTVEAQRDELERRCAKLQAELTSANAKLDRASQQQRDEARLHEEAMASLRTELSSERARARAASVSVTSSSVHDLEVSHLDAQVRSLTSERDRLTARLTETQAQSEEQTRRLTSELTLMQQTSGKASSVFDEERRSLNAQIAALRREKKDLSDSAEALRVEAARERESHSIESAKSAGLALDVERLMRAQRDAARELSDVSAERDTLRSQLTLSQVRGKNHYLFGDRITSSNFFFFFFFFFF